MERLEWRGVHHGESKVRRCDQSLGEVYVPAELDWCPVLPQNQTSWLVCSPNVACLLCQEGISNGIICTGYFETFTREPRRDCSSSSPPSLRSPCESFFNKVHSSPVHPLSYSGSDFIRERARSTNRHSCRTHPSRHLLVKDDAWAASSREKLDSRTGADHVFRTFGLGHE